MTRRPIRIFVSLVMTLLPGAPGLAQDSELFIATVSSDPRRCNLGRARRIALERLVRDYEALRHRCVAVRGHWRGGALFASARDAQGGDALHARRLAGRRLGLYGRDEILNSASWRTSRPAIAVGIVGSCETLGDRDTVVLGYCHSVARGPYIALAELHPDR